MKKYFVEEKQQMRKQPQMKKTLFEEKPQMKKNHK